MIDRSSPASPGPAGNGFEQPSYPSVPPARPWAVLGETVEVGAERRGVGRGGAEDSKPLSDIFSSVRPTAAMAPPLRVPSSTACSSNHHRTAVHFPHSPVASRHHRRRTSQQRRPPRSSPPPSNAVPCSATLPHPRNHHRKRSPAMIPLHIPCPSGSTAVSVPQFER